MTAPTYDREFTCVECGSRVVQFVSHYPEALCFTCIMLPGWHTDPALRARLGPNLPPLPSGGCAQ
jgi:hypothetical protein